MNMQEKKRKRKGSGGNEKIRTKKYQIVFSVLLFILLTIDVLKDNEIGIFASFGTWTSWSLSIICFVYVILTLITLGIRAKNSYNEKE